jgi:dihydrofolate reductase
MLSMIVAMSESARVIGLNGDMPWKLRADLQRFKRLTTGHTVVMGRKTWESIPTKFRPLPDRLNIVLSRNAGYQAEGATVFRSLDEMTTQLASAEDSHTFLIGGATLYEAGLEVADRLYVTFVDYTGPGDTFFPEDPWAKFKPLDLQEQAVPADEKNSHATRFLIMERR